MRNKPLWIGSLLLLLLIVIAYVGPYTAYIDKELSTKIFIKDEDGKLMKPPYPPSSEYLLGSDAHGRDLLSLLVIGAKDTLFLILSIAALRYVIAVPLGTASAILNYERLNGLLRGIHGFFTGLPTLFATVLIISLPIAMIDHSNRLLFIIIVVAFVEVGRVAYIFQQQTLAISKSTYMEAGIAVGNTPFGLFLRYYWRNLLPHLVTNFVLDLSRILIIVGQLGFISIFYSYLIYDVNQRGWAVESITNAWPVILSESRNYIRNSISLPYFVSCAIVYTIISFNLVGEGLRRYFENKASSGYNPKLEKKVMKELRLEKERIADQKKGIPIRPS